MATAVDVLDQADAENLCTDYHSLDGVLCEYVTRVGVPVTWNEWQKQFYNLAKMCEEKGYGDAHAARHAPDCVGEECV